MRCDGLWLAYDGSSGLRWISGVVGLTRGAIERCNAICQETSGALVVPFRLGRERQVRCG